MAELLVQICSRSLYSPGAPITCLRADTCRLTPEGFSIFHPSASPASPRPQQRGLSTDSARAGRVPRGVARRADAGRRAVRASAAVRGLLAPPPPSRRRAGQKAGRADGAAMFVARSIAADHKDLIHDVSFDFHGRRMATCSSDQSVKVRAGRSAAQGRGRRGRREGRREAARTEADPTETHAIRGHRRRRPGSGESPSHRRIVGSRPPALAVLFLCRACAGVLPASGL